MFEDKMNCESVQRAVSDSSMLELTAAENEHLAACDTCADLLMTQMLQQKPDIAIPAEFASRVRSQLPDSAIAPRPNSWIPGYGSKTTIALLMLLALVWGILDSFGPHGWMSTSRLDLVIEYVIAFEIAAIALWLGLRRPAGS